MRVLIVFIRAGRRYKTSVCVRRTKNKRKDDDKWMNFQAYPKYSSLS